MKKLELKRDPLVIIPYTAFTIGLLVVLAMKLITWPQFLIGLGALNLPAAFGLTRSRGDEDSKSDPPPATPSDRRTPRDGRGILTALLLIGATMLVAHTTACGYGATACKVIDIAQANCVWLKYLEEDGSEQQVKLTPKEARDFGRAMAKKRAAELDGGSP